jgi:hypothetical protein
MRESRFVRLTNYCLVEYMLEELGSTDFITDDFILLQNDHLNSHQIFNNDGSFPVTRNIQDVSTVAIGSGTYVHLDSEKIPDYIDYDDDLTATIISGHNVVLDKVRFHFIAGFDFNDFRALVLSVKNKENDAKINVFCSILLSQDTIDTLISFNPKPLYIANAMYDRYVDVYVPSIKNINEDFNTSPTPALTFSAAITPTDTSYSGFVTNNPITISIDECGTQDTIQTDINVTYDSFKVSEHFETTVSQSNEFDTVGAYIDQSASGDFIEFFLTYNGGFPEELIAILNRRNPLDNWVIAHELTVYEQLGSSFVESSRLVFFQDGNFDEPNLFRPVLKNANQAVSMSIDYIVRLINKSNGDQIIREGAYILLSPKKYGLQLLKIELQDKPQSQKIYNKIYKKNFEATELFIDPSQSGVTSYADLQSTPTTVVKEIEYVPIFFSNNLISISQRNAKIMNSDNMEEVIFGQGKLRFVLSPFDNYIKFKLYTFVSGKPIPLDLNLNAPTYRAVFETSSGKIKIDNLGDPSKENLSDGEIVFNISNENSEEIIQSKDKSFYITSVAQDGTETAMYNGEWRKSSEQSEVNDAISQANEDLREITDIETKITDIETKVDENLKKQIRRNLKNIKNLRIDIPGLVLKKARKSVATVNRFGMKNATKITSNRSLSANATDTDGGSS